MIVLILIHLITAVVLIKMQERLITLENQISYHRVRIERLERRD